MSRRRRISGLKWGLALAALAIGALLLFWPEDDEWRLSTEAQSSADEDDLKNRGVEDVAASTILQPRYSGEDGKGRRWEVTASRARQIGTTEESTTIDLNDVDAAMTTGKGESVRFIASHGIFKRAENQLVLEDRVEITGYGFKLLTPRVTADLTTRRAWSDKQVLLNHAGGELFAGELEIIDNGAIIRLKEGVVAQFRLPDTDESS